MNRRWEGRPTASLFGRLLILVGASLLAAQAISIMLIVVLPPPIPDFYRLSEVEQALRGGPSSYAERRPLVLRTSPRPPSPVAEGRMVPPIRAELAEHMGVAIEDVVIGGDRSPFSDRRVYRILRDRMAREGAEEHFLVAPFSAAIRQPDGQWKIVRPEGFGLDPWQRRMVLWFILSTLAMAPAAYLYARRIARPLGQFAEAAERLGKDPRAEPLTLDLRGTAEINVAAQAFNEMQERLRRYVEDRTAMVGAIAHDLRTPLTRLRFRIENAPEELRAKMAGDLDQMEEMISAALAFVRDASRPGERTKLELSSLLESICDEMAETGSDTHVVASERVVLNGDPVALRRLFVNLIENAVKFGGKAHVRIRNDEAFALVEIDDDGPGVPEAELDRVFEPFYRREPSRSRETGGIGLGLAVVRSVARGHGGDVELANRPEGGLTARVRLPI